MVRSKVLKGSPAIYIVALFTWLAEQGRSGFTPSAFTPRIPPASVDDEDSSWKVGIGPRRRSNLAKEKAWLACRLTRWRRRKGDCQPTHPAMVVFLRHIVRLKDSGTTRNDNRRLILSIELLSSSQAYAPISARQTVLNLQTLLCLVAHLK